MAYAVLKVISCIFLLIIVWPLESAYNFSGINLPLEHLPFFFKNFPEAAEACRKNALCPFKMHLDKDVCWGYEDHCPIGGMASYSKPSCPGDPKGWVQTKQAQIATFFSQGDFGYIKDKLHGMQMMCEPTFREDSSLECSKHLHFCRARNIMINFTDLAHRPEMFRYKMDVLKEGQIGGYCRLHKERLLNEADQLSPLQSWGPEFKNFVNLPKRPIENGDCTIIIDRPTYIMKIDAAVNMYHHFCDFLNLYASLHMNASSGFGDGSSFWSQDTLMLIWETHPYQSAFQEAFSAFTYHPVLNLRNFEGQVACFRNVIFPLLPRMIFGLYYNTPLIWGCHKSGLFHAFSKHMLHRLGIVRTPARRREGKIRVTLMSRDTPYRRILNEEELIAGLEENPDYSVRRVVYNRFMSFSRQMEITHNSDIFIGIHGAGLTHLLFLPDWGVVFELYNCEDESCYLDLARLRGIKYLTWENKSLLYQQDQGHHPEGGAHAKFTNYAFDVAEFLRIVDIGAQYVLSQRSFKNYKSEHDEL
ncbi:hypothetical protein J437_LFUL005264 [Ladona fulva]|uniref:EGF domain-specific O-linked N-acetylglucosamine transferase n=1 Tax=Ladona fulva TaxID=123851 RepID=A0A8K0JW42_LADFU|nr:hypothetical protein J437_LFUL005264 [Ladona fulva]